MLRGRALYVLRSIALGAEQSAQRARVAAYRRVDPLFRNAIRARVTRAVARVALASDHAGDEAHVHRLAYLELAGAAPANPNDRDAVRNAFDAALRAVPERTPARWTPTLLLAGLLLAAAGAAVLGYALTRPEPLRATQPGRRDAYVYGGRPAPGSAEVTRLLGVELETLARQLLVLAELEDEGERSALRKRFDHDSAALFTHAGALLGPELASFLRAVLDQALAMTVDPASPAEDSFVRSIDAFNAGVAARGLGYYVDGEVVRSHASGAIRVYLASFAVERVSIYRSGKTTLRALLLARLDRQPFTRAALGFTRPQVRDGLVLLSRVEGWLIGSVVPALEEGGSLALIDAASRKYHEPWMDEVERYAAGAVRAECDRLTADVGGYAPLTDALARRRKLLADWRDRFATHGVTVRDPDGYTLVPDDYFSLRATVPGFEWRELEQIADALASPGVKAGYLQLEQAVLASIERHELQHRLDYENGVLERLPIELEQRVGPLEAFGLQNVLAEHALAELSAYLSELARGPEVVQLNLALFAHHLFDRERLGTPECYAALVVFDGLSRSLGLSGEPLVRGRFVARDQVARVYKKLRATPADELTRAARKLWEELFDRPLPELVLISE